MANKKVDYNKYELKWYVLNGCDWFSNEDTKFNNYPYSYYGTKVRPWNVFRNWVFKEAAVDLALAYYNGDFTLETLKEDNMEYPYNIETNTWDGPCVKKEVAELKTDYEAFRYQLMRELAYEEHGRTEYEVCIADWPPVYVNKDGKPISVYTNQEHEAIDDVKMDKTDTYQQVLPNEDIFAKYVLLTVNGTLLTKATAE